MLEALVFPLPLGSSLVVDVFPTRAASTLEEIRPGESHPDDIFHAHSASARERIEDVRARQSDFRGQFHRRGLVAGFTEEQEFRSEGVGLGMIACEEGEEGGFAGAVGPAQVPS